MEFISAEEFLKQPKEIQKVFLDWWVPSIGDLVYFDEDIEIGCVTESNIQRYGYSNGIGIGIKEDSYVQEKEDSLPLLTEGQIRQFIEDKTNCKLNIGNISKIINIYKKELDIPYETNLLQAYWKVALEIAKEC